MGIQTDQRMHATRSTTAAQFGVVSVSDADSESVYEKHADALDELAERDDVIGALARAKKRTMEADDE